MKQIILTQNTFAMVDDTDFDFLSQWKWYLSRSGYAVRSEYDEDGKGRTIAMHREIMNPPPKHDVDHRNTNKIDNQRHNLRVATRSQNAQNGRKIKPRSSIYKGVTWVKRLRKWAAQIKHPTIGEVHLGVFMNELDAAKAYDKAAIAFHGDFARLNFGEQMNKQIVYNRDTKDFDMFLDGAYIGSRATYSQSETDMNAYVYELLMHQQN